MKPLLMTIAVCALALPVPARADSGVREVQFSIPGNDRHIVLVRDLLGETPSGATVRACLFRWDDEKLASRFVQAARRGVKVRAIAHPFDERSYRKAHKELSKLNEIDDCSFHAFESGPGTKNHNKFVLFSEVEREKDAWRHVVCQTSGNFTDASKKKYQNTIVFEDPVLYSNYERYWEDIMKHGRADTNDLDYYSSCADGVEWACHGSDAESVRLYFSPRKQRRGNPSDTIVTALEGVRMTTNRPRPHIRVAMARWSSERRLIAERLVTLASSGALVEVVIREPGESPVDPPAVAPLLEDDAPVRVWFAPGSLHSKYMLMDGVHGEEDPSEKKIVWTGSQNYTGTGLRSNDEILLEITDDAVHDEYVVDFERLKSVSKRIK